MQRINNYPCQLIVTRSDGDLKVEMNGFPLSCLNIGIKAVIDISRAMGIDNNVLLMLFEKSL